MFGDDFEDEKWDRDFEREDEALAARQKDGWHRPPCPACGSIESDPACSFCVRAEGIARALHIDGPSDG